MAAGRAGTGLRAQYVRDFLGPSKRFTVKPVIDLAGQAPVEAYESPGGSARRSPAHPDGRVPVRVEYQPPDGPRPHRPYRHTDKPLATTRPSHPQKNQTGMDNLGALGRFLHRVPPTEQGRRATVPRIYL